MKDQEISNQTQSTTIQKNRFRKRNVKRHPKESDLHGSLSFEKLVQEIKKMSPEVHFQQTSTSFSGAKDILVRIV